MYIDYVVPKKPERATAGDLFFDGRAVLPFLLCFAPSKVVGAHGMSMAIIEPGNGSDP